MKNPPRNSQTPEQLAARAHQLLEQKQFKEAITAYKELLKSKPDFELEQALASAYRGRSTELAAKGMYLEAVVLWENQAKLVNQSPCTAEYVIWLMQAGAYTRLANMVDAVTLALEPQGLARPVLETLAIMALDDNKLLAQFPKDHAIVRHQPIILKALQFYSAGRDAEVESCLQQIPSRSFYREVRTLLKALLMLQVDRAGGLDLMGSISKDSMVWDIAQSLRRNVSDAGVDSEEYQVLGSKLQAIVTKLNGYDKRQLNLLRELKKTMQTRSDRVAFEFALGNKTILGHEAVRKFCLALLIDYPEGLKLYERNFGALPVLQKIRLQALIDENERYSDDAIMSWMHYVDKLASTETDEARFNRIKAEILRYCYDLANGNTANEKAKALQFLAQSLNADPYDKLSYIQLIQGYSELAPKQAQQWLDKALDIYPRDVELLALAMKSAAERKAFKKAASYARTILAVDSINSSARAFLMDAHLGHARKQIKANRLDLAELELEEIRSLDMYNRNSSRYYLEGIIAGIKLETERSIEMIEKGFSLEDSVLTAELSFMIERATLDLLSRGGTKYPSCLDKKYVPSRNDMRILVQFINRVPKTLRKNLHKALLILQPVIKKGISDKIVLEVDCFDLCQAFANIEACDFLLLCSQLYLTWNPDSPAARFFDLFAECNGLASSFGHAELSQLSAILNQAEDLNDSRTINLAARFMGKHVSEMQNREAEFFDSEFGIAAIAGEYPDFDPTKLAEFFKRLQHIQAMSSKQLTDYLGPIYGKSAVRNLEPYELMELGLQYIIDDVGIDKADVERLFNQRPS